MSKAKATVAEDRRYYIWRLDVKDHVFSHKCYGLVQLMRRNSERALKILYTGFRVSEVKRASELEQRRFTTTTVQ